MTSKYISEVENVIKQLHGVESKHIQSVPVKETFQGKTVWEGSIRDYRPSQSIEAVRMGARYRRPEETSFCNSTTHRAYHFGSRSSASGHHSGV